MSEAVIVWFRRDLRLADNPALHHARRSGAAVIPVYIYAPGEEAPWEPGAASRVWLHRSLEVLARGLEAAGSRLLLRRGEPAAELAYLARRCGAGRVFCNRLYEPAQQGLEARVQAALGRDGIRLSSYPGHLINEPDTVLNKQGGPFKVFTPYWRYCRRAYGTDTDTLPGVRKLPAPARWPDTERLAGLNLLPPVRWYDGIDSAWSPGCRGALRALKAFAGEGVQRYGKQRDLPSRDGVSRLSPHLHFGEVSPRQVIRALTEADQARGLASPSQSTAAYIRQLYWRDFGHYLLHHFPQTPEQPLYGKYRDFPWRRDRRRLAAWQRGETGYPIVDAGMRELWHTGWMHNRVRMIAGSFLVKDLLIHWLEGANWFWDTLVDADLANNTLGWQWVAGCGADAAPFFRIFNPVTQGERFDPDGDYVRRWLPQLARLDNRFIHKPWQAAPLELEAAGIRPGRDYPRPLVDHAEARRAALAAFQRIK